MIDMNRHLIEIASWRLISELSRRAPGMFTVIGTHPGGGLYNCMSLYTKTGLHLADINRAGRLHVFHRSDGQPSTDEPTEIWQAMLHADDPKPVLDEVCRRLAFSIPTSLPSTTPETLVYRLIAAFLTHAA